MTTNLNDYFNLGLESTNNPVNNAGMINVFRSPVDTSSANLNRVTFKFPKSGLLTGDSMITLQFVTADGLTSNLTPNLVNGAIGSIKRTRILVDNKPLVDLQRPGLAENVKLYSRNTQIELAEKEYKMMGNQFRTTVNEDGEEALDIHNLRFCADNDQIGNDIGLTKNRISSVANSKVYGIKLKHLGAEFLEAASLPVFLLGNREIVLELEFHSDCREYIVNPTGAAVGAGDVKVSLADMELVSTHIMLPPDVEENERMALAKRPVTYPLLDSYVIKGTVDSTGTPPTTKNQTYRINFQNREVHNLLMCQVDTTPGNSRVCANQRANSLGKEELQLKVNGQNLFDRPIVDQSLIYQLTTYSEDGRTLKIPYNAFRVDATSLGSYRQNLSDLYLDYRGAFHYTKIDFSNGNLGVFGAGTLMKTACEIDYKVTTATATSPNQNAIRDVFFYATISKLLTIGASQVNISY